MKRIAEIIRRHVKTAAVLFAVAFAALIALESEAQRLAPVMTRALKSPEFKSAITEVEVNAEQLELPIINRSIPAGAQTSPSEPLSSKAQMVKTHPEFTSTKLPKMGLSYGLNLDETKHQELNSLVANRYFNYSSSQSTRPNVPINAKLNLDAEAINFADRALANFPKETLEGNLPLTQEQYNKLMAKLETFMREGEKEESVAGGTAAWSGSFDLTKGAAEIEFKYGNFKLKGDLFILVAAIGGYAIGAGQSPKCIVRKWLPENMKNIYPVSGKECAG